VNAADVMEILTIASVTNEKEIDDALVNVWLQVVGTYSKQQGLDALYAHTKESPFFPKPSDIVKQVRLAVQQRREVYGLHPAPPAGKRWAADVIEHDPRFGELER
jgi:hypothetical protein